MAVSLGFSRFSLRLGEIARVVGGNSDCAVRASMTAAVETIVPGTPVKTGLARGNWTVQIGTPFEGKKTATDPVGQRTINAAKDVIAGYKAGRRAFLSNNLDYIDALDRGHSAQAPNGFSRQAFAAARRAAARARLLQGV